MTEVNLSNADQFFLKILGERCASVKAKLEERFVGEPLEIIGAELDRVVQLARGSCEYETVKAAEDAAKAETEKLPAYPDATPPPIDGKNIFEMIESDPSGFIRTLNATQFRACEALRDAFRKEAELDDALST